MRGILCPFYQKVSLWSKYVEVIHHVKSEYGEGMLINLARGKLEREMLWPCGHKVPPKSYY